MIPVRKSLSHPQQQILIGYEEEMKGYICKWVWTSKGCSSWTSLCSWDTLFSVFGKKKPLTPGHLFWTFHFWHQETTICECVWTEYGASDKFHLVFSSHVNCVILWKCRAKVQHFKPKLLLALQRRMWPPLFSRGTGLWLKHGFLQCVCVYLQMLRPFSLTRHREISSHWLVW